MVLVPRVIVCFAVFLFLLGLLLLLLPLTELEHGVLSGVDPHLCMFSTIGH